MKHKLKNYFEAFLFILKMFAMGIPLIGSWFGLNIFIFIMIGRFWEEACTKPPISNYCSNIYFNIFQGSTFILGFALALLIFYIEHAEKRINFNLIKNQRFIKYLYIRILKTMKIPYCIKKRDIQCSLYIWATNLYVENGKDCRSQKIS